jgi:cell division inhibitor SepF
MGVRDLWHRTLVYFGLAEDESFYDDDDEGTSAHADDRSHRDRDRDRDRDRGDRERSSVRRFDRDRPRRASREHDADDMFGGEPDVVRRTRGYGDDGATTSVLRRDQVRTREREPQEATTAVKVHLIAPRSFNDAQQIADRFKNAIPVIINLQTAEPELSKRLIDFGSGLTYALDGGMSRIAEKVFLLTPKNVEVSAEDRARLVEQGFFNPA